ncbi:MAG: HAMP domain-containing histidine kinase [candidate division KSB1 bacterium]|nr:HAMP domain-containing histidine kinase [candidate division KSB1 bacterium]MDZ7302920.1 HAMP domain-containing histidine kinase [candidate division KSB1 bacterium]MDZ7310495.1 HAMP domain-containing histidine kinase [candidate division KSB1 bacterium]
MRTRSLKTRFFSIIAMTLVAPAFLTMLISYVGTRRTISKMVQQNFHDDLQRWQDETAAVRGQCLTNLCDLLAVTHNYAHQFRVFGTEQRIFEHQLKDKLADFLCAHSEVYVQALWVSAAGRPKAKFILSPIYLMTCGRPLKLEEEKFESSDEILAQVAPALTREQIWFGPSRITGDGFASTIGIPLQAALMRKTHGECALCANQFGTIFLELRLNYLFSEAARRAQMFTDAIPMVFDSSGTILYHPRAEFICQKLTTCYPALASHISTQKVFHGPTPGLAAPVRFKHDGHQWAMLSNRSNEQYHFALFLEEEKIIRRLQSLYWINLAIMLLGGVVAVSLLGLAFRRMGRTVGELAAGAHAIARGDLDRRVAIDSEDELGVLGRAFNHMAASLKGLIRERAEKEKLQELNQLKDAFVSNVSHELKGPLNRIELGIENLRRGVAGVINEKQQLYLYRIQENTRRLIRMIDDLLEVSRIEAGRMALELSLCAVKEILAEVIEEARPQWQRKSLRVSDACTEENLHLLADRDKLKQILSNLLDNAIKFTAENGEISLHAEKQNGCIELIVADTGIGIAPEHLEHLFERFYQVHAHVSGRDNGKNSGLGLGLGLNIVKALVELHNGEIAVDSKLGVGTRVTVRLPAKSAESLEQSAEHLPSPGAKP